MGNIIGLSEKWAISKDIELPEALSVYVKYNGEEGHSKKKSPRQHELRELIKCVYEEMKNNLGHNPNSNQVWSALKSYDEGDIIDEMKNGRIYWTSRRGNQQKMERSTFDNYISKLRNTQ